MNKLPSMLITLFTIILILNFILVFSLPTPFKELIEFTTSTTSYNCSNYADGSPRYVGDINGDKQITPGDIEAIQNIYFEKATIDDICCADLNQDGQVTFADANLAYSAYFEDKGLIYGTCPEEEKLNLSISLSTLRDRYSAGEQVNLTDPPEENKEISLEPSLDGIYSQTYLNATPYEGYIVQFEDPPILEKKIELEKRYNIIEKAAENLQSIYEETEIMSSINLLVYIDRRFIDFAIFLMSFQKETITETKIVTIQSELENEKNKINTLHESFKSEIGIEPEKVIGDFSYVFNGIALNITDGEAKQIKQLNEVKEIYPNYEVYPMLQDSIPLINADDVWQLQDAQGRNITGQDVTIAIIDTGIDYTHPDLGGCFGSGCKVIGGYDVINNDSDPIDNMGHGTHCAGIAAGNGVLKGVAPDAKLYAYKVFEEDVLTWNSVIIEAIERSIDPNQDGNFSDKADIISMSLGGPGNPDDAMSQAVDNAVDAGVVVVVAAGNSGPEGDGRCGRGYFSVCSPGTARKVITVGATDKNDTIAIFSSAGPVISENSALIKPDVLAPGVNICAAQYDNWYDELHCLDDEHISISGTSMAAPHVSGAAALLKQAYPNWTPEEIKSAFVNTALDLGYNVYIQGTGRIDMLRAINSSLKFSPQSLSKLILPSEQEINLNVTIKNTHIQSHGVKIKTLNSVTNILKRQNYTISLDISPETFCLNPNENLTVKLNATSLSPLPLGPYSGILKIEDYSKCNFSANPMELSLPFGFSKIKLINLTILSQVTYKPDEFKEFSFAMTGPNFTCAGEWWRFKGKCDDFYWPKPINLLGEYQKEAIPIIDEGMTNFTDFITYFFTRASFPNYDKIQFVFLVNNIDLKNNEKIDLIIDEASATQSIKSNVMEIINESDRSEMLRFLVNNIILTPLKTYGEFVNESRIMINISRINNNYSIFDHWSYQAPNAVYTKIVPIVFNYPYRDIIMNDDEFVKFEIIKENTELFEELEKSFFASYAFVVRGTLGIPASTKIKEVTLRKDNIIRSIGPFEKVDLVLDYRDSGSPNCWSLSSTFSAENFSDTGLQNFSVEFFKPPFSLDLMAKPDIVMPTFKDSDEDLKEFATFLQCSGENDIIITIPNGTKIEINNIESNDPGDPRIINFILSYYNGTCNIHQSVGRCGPNCIIDCQVGNYVIDWQLKNAFKNKILWLNATVHFNGSEFNITEKKTGSIDVEPPRPKSKIDNLENESISINVTMKIQKDCRDYQLGDVNHDGVVNLTDGYIIYDMYLGLIPKDMCGDINEDGVITPGDSQLASEGQGKPGKWQDYQVVLPSTEYTISAQDYLALDTIWNAQNVVVNVAGKYRAYAAIVDENGNVVINTENESLEANWEFEII